MIATPESPASDDALMPLKQLLDEVGISYDTGLGWTRNGVAGHRLEVFRKGGRLWCRPSWLALFISKLNR